jgi:anthranilate synthase/aminodeoxychorismate synthase-like glutamine amidotransferase
VILLIDNYDSFVHILAAYVRELGGEPLVLRPDALDVEAAAALAPTHVIVSPGPRRPADAPLSIELVRRLGPTTPVLGVCLGHQCIAEAYGARVARAAHPLHGRASAIRHDGGGLFGGLPSPFRATRYHSLAIVRESLPPALAVTATADDGEIMAVSHRAHPVHGVQFHPESILSEHGHAILAAFLALRGA